MKRFLMVVALGVSCVSMVACGGQEKNAIHGNVVNYPEWVNRSSGAFEGENGWAFYGVGSVRGTSNPALARSTADNRARNEIARLLETYSASLMKDYMSSTTAGDFSASSEEQHIEQAIKTFTAQTMHGTMIIDHWHHPDGTLYALARLDLSKMVEELEKVQELDAKVRDHVRKNSERVMMDLDREEAKHEAE